MKCSKTFTLTVNPPDTVCPVYQATVALPGGVLTGHLAFYSASVTPGVPNKFFANDLTAMIVINADTRAIIANVNLALRMPYRHGVVAPGANKILYIVNDGATGFDRIEGMDVDGYAITGTPYALGGDSYNYIEYDPTHNEIGSFFTDGATGQSYLRRHNATTMAQIASTAAGALWANNQTISYDLNHDRYYTGYLSGGAFALRGYDRATGALVLNVAFAAQIASVVYEHHSDKIYAVDVGSNLFRCNGGTGAVELTVPMGAVNGLRPMQYWHENTCLVGLCQNPWGNDIIGLDGTHVCNINGDGVCVALFGDQIAMREWVTNDLLIYQV